MSLLKIINARKNPIVEVSSEDSGGCGHSIKTIVFRVESNNLYEDVIIEAEVSGDDECRGSYTLRQSGTVLSQGSLNHRNEQVTYTVRLPTNVSLELTIEAIAPTLRINSRGEAYIVSTSCQQDSRHRFTLVSSLHVSIGGALSSSVNSTVWVDDDEGGLGGGLIP